MHTGFSEESAGGWPAVWDCLGSRTGGRVQAKTLPEVATGPPLRQPGWPVDLAVMTTASDPIALTLSLMSIDSTSGREGEVIAWLDAYLAARGWRTQRIP